MRPARARLATIALATAALALVAAVPPATTETPSPVDRDLYGGMKAVSLPATGYFRLQELGGRWVLVSPQGHPLWLRAVYGVDSLDGGVIAQAALSREFHGNSQAFARQAAGRLIRWGFNALGGYASSYALPVPTYFRPEGNSERLPFIRLLNISWYGAINEGQLAPAPFKTLLAGAVDPNFYHGWMGNVPDVFDPNFPIYARNLAADRATVARQTVFTARTAQGGDPQPSLAASPWLLGTTPDDADDLFGFGPGPEAAGSDGAIHPNLGWIVAVTKPEQRANHEVGEVIAGARTIRYRDPVVYAKLAWRNMLERKYRTIAALNAAWGSDYTTFGSDGGWPTGRGLLDENGRHRWIGNDPYRLSRTAPNVRADMNAFVASYADRYFAVVAAAIRAATPRQLIFSPVLDSHGGLTRPAILRAAARYCDALQVAPDPARPEVAARTYSLTAKPLFAWLGVRADAASIAASGEFAAPRTQAQRGRDYARDVAWLFSFRTASGVAPFFGLDWWEYMDKASEHANWGLVSAADVPYDGRRLPASGRQLRPDGGPAAAAVPAADFLGAVTAANQAVDRQLLQALRRARRGPGGKGI